MGWGPGPAKYDLLFQNISSLLRRLQKTSHRNKKLFFSILTLKLAESVDVEGLNSSLAHSPGEV